MSERTTTTTASTPADSVLAEHAAAIRALGKRVIADVIEIGRRLTDAKAIAGHGNWLPWLEREFGWSEKTAERFMSVHMLGGKFDNLSNMTLPVSGLYLLAAPSTPEEARDAIIDRAQAGEPVSVAEIKRTIDTAKNRTQPARKAARKTAAEIAFTQCAPTPNPPSNDAAPTPAGAATVLASRNDIGPDSAGERERQRVRDQERENETRRLVIRCRKAVRATVLATKQEMPPGEWTRLFRALRDELSDLAIRAAVDAAEATAAPAPPVAAEADDLLGIPDFLKRTAGATR